MTQKELLAKCSERDQEFLDYFHPKVWDLKSFTDQIEFDKVPYTNLIDYHAVIHNCIVGGIFTHIFTIEARYEEDAENFYKYLRDEVIDEYISDYSIKQLYNTDYYIIIINID